MNWDLFFEIGNFAIGVVGVIGGTVGILFWRSAKKEKEANAQTAKIEAMGKEADFAETMLQKFEKVILARMDSGEAVRKQEFDQLRTDIGSQLSDIQVENRAQNETIGTMSELLTDIKEYLNGGFAAFEAQKHTKPTKGRRK